MSTTVFDSALFRDMFGTPEMRDVFSDTAYLARCIDAETALARAQAKAGLIPAEAAREITARADFSRLDLERCARKRRSSAIRSCRSSSRSARCAVKRAAICTGARPRRTSWTRRPCCNARRAWRSSNVSSMKCAAHCAISPSKHADTVTAGRTHLQHALPVTFGFRAAVWLSALNRHAERLQQAKPRALMVAVRRRGGHAGFA